MDGNHHLGQLPCEGRHRTGREEREEKRAAPSALNRRREEEARKAAGFDMSWLTLEAIGVGVCERSLSAWDLSVLRREGGIIECSDE
jgi:hypothetical protein